MVDIQKRFDRILAVYMHLQSKPVVTATELADRYEVSLRTIYRDIRSLIAAGVPIYGEAGHGYSLVSGYKMPPIHFGREEALSFVAAEKLIEKYADPHLSYSFATALHKIKAILRSADKQHVALTEGKLLVRGGESSFNENVQNGLNVLMESIVSRRCVAISYLKPSETKAGARAIESIGVFIDGGFWYVLAYCRLRQDIRQFRLDRIQSMTLLEDGFTNEYRELAYYLESKPKVPKTEVMIEVDKEIVRYLDWDRRYFGFVSEQILEDHVAMCFQSTNAEETFARWLMTFADHIRVVKPRSLQNRVQELLNKALKRWT